MEMLIHVATLFIVFLGADYPEKKRRL